MPLILPANTLSDAGYDIANSCRFNRADSATLSRTLASGSSTTKFTLSFWFKAYTLSGTARFFHCDGTRDTYMRWNSSGTVEIGLHDNSGDVGAIITNRLFRDPSAWMNFVIRFDSTESAANDRFRFYVNGVDERGVGGYSTDTMPDADDVCQVNLSGNAQKIGGKSAQYVDGYLAEMILSMGYSYAPTEFGEFDEDSPTIWKPKEFGGTIGTNGFYLDFEASGNLGNDVSGGTDFDENNIVAADQATDSPTNNFCVMNPLDNNQHVSVFSEGNCKFQTTNTAFGYNTGTIGVSTGKWYYECEVLAESAAQMSQIGFSDNTGEEQYLQNNCYPYVGSSVNGYGYSANGYYKNNNSQSPTGFSTYTTDIISVYLDLDNSEIYWAKNDTMENSGTGKWGAALPAGTFMFPACADFSTPSYNVLLGANFGGCPPVAPDSAVADAEGYGAFEYDPSRGGASDFDSGAKDFLAICTKNLAEYG